MAFHKGRAAYASACSEAGKSVAGSEGRASVTGRILQWATLASDHACNGRGAHKIDPGLAPMPRTLCPVRANASRALRRELLIMNCFDCALRHEESTAVAVCHRCGVGVCTDDAYVTEVFIHRPLGMVRSTLPVPARQVACATCHAAEASATTSTQRQAVSSLSN